MAPAAKPHNDSQIKALTALGLLGSVGLVVALPIVGGVVVGVYLGGGLVLVGLIFVGLFAGLYGAYRILAKDLPWNR